MPAMKNASLGLDTLGERTRKAAFLAERVGPWAALVELVALYAPEGRRGRPTVAAETMMRIETVHDVPLAKGLLLRAGTVVDATLIAAPSLTRNKAGERDPEMHPSKKGNPWHFGMKAHIGVDADSGLVHTVKGSAGNVNDVVEANALLHGQEAEVFGDAGYQGADKRPDAPADVCWNVAMRPGKRRAPDKSRPLVVAREALKKELASIQRCSLLAA